MKTSQAPCVTAPCLVPGEIIGGRYRILSSLGEGGMGRVYEVEHRHIGHRLALKLQHPNARGRQVDLAREARLLGLIESEHVVRVIDFGVDRLHGPYLAMERLRGGTLAEKLALRGRLSWDRALSVGLSVCEALADVHRQDLIHRDLKPQNIGLVGGGPEVKLLDFGLSAHVSELSREGTGSTAGTPAYMAPELWRGAPASFTTDLFALGVILFEMVTGELPFTGPPPFLADSLRPLASPRQLADQAEVPIWLAEVIATLLQASPYHRYQHATDVAAALRRFDPLELGSTVDVAAGVVAKGSALAWLGDPTEPQLDRRLGWSARGGRTQEGAPLWA